MAIPTELTDLTENTYYWTQQESDSFAVLAFSPASSAFEVVRSFNETELAEISPKLAPALRGLVKWHLRWEGNTRVRGHLVRSLFSLTLDDVVHCRQLNGPTLVLQHVYGYALYPDEPDRVTLDGMLQKLRTEFVDGVEVSLVTRVDPADVHVSKADLDTRYPGWIERWHIGVELGIKRDELRRYIFPTMPPVAALSPIGLQFD